MSIDPHRRTHGSALGASDRADGQTAAELRYGPSVEGRGERLTALEATISVAETVHTGRN